MKAKLKFLLPLLLFWSTSSAQETSSLPSFYFGPADIPIEEYASHINTIVQDSLGFMWFGSQFGLHRWDGHHLKTFLHDPYDSTSIASDIVKDLYVAKNGSLFVGLWGEGLDRFDYETESFQHCLDEARTPENFYYILVSDIQEDGKGNLWVATTEGLYRLHLQTNELTYYVSDPTAPNSLSHSYCESLLIDVEGTLWIGTGNIWSDDPRGGLNRYRPETEDFVQYVHDPGDSTSLANDKITEMFEDSRGNFWVGTGGDGLHRMNRASGTFKRFPRKDFPANQLAAPFYYPAKNQHITFIFEDKHQKLWIGCWDGGILYHDPENGGLGQPFFDDPEDPLALPELYPWTLFQSRDGTLWGSTTGPGKHLFQIRETLLETHPFSDERNHVYGFTESRKDHLWISTAPSGLIEFDLKTKTQEIFDNKRIQAPKSNLPNASLPDVLNYPDELLKYNFRMVADETGRLWISRPQPDGMLRIDPESGELMAYLHDPQDEQSISKGVVGYILKDKMGQIWAATYDGVLNLYNPETDDFQKFPFVSPEDHEGFMRIVLALSKEGDIWITASYEYDSPNILLKKFNPTTHTFQTYEADMQAYDPSLPLGELLDVIEDDAGNLWMGSKAQVFNIHPDQSEQASFSIRDVGGRFFNGIKMDQQGRLWLFGDNIYLLDPKTKQHATFKTTFSTNVEPGGIPCMYQDSAGHLYFGGQGGMHIIDPEKVKSRDKNNHLKTILYDFQLLYEENGENGSSGAHFDLSSLQEIQLTHDQNAFSVRFATLSFLESETNRYQFQLENYDEGWRNSGLEPIAIYAKVPPGTYVLKVRGAVQGREWETENSIRITISPPWWATWWAYCLYAVLFLGSLFGFYRFQLNRRLEKAEAIRIKELNTVKERLYTNITHEFRTPLTVIMGLAENLKGHEQERNLISRNSKNLLRLINQMLGLSKLESGNMQLDLVQGEIISYLRYLTASFHSMAEAKELELEFQSDIPSLIMDYDEEKIQHIVYNLLSNAIKFTHSGGRVQLSVGATSTDQISIVVSDTGNGIPEEERLHIFDRFYQAESGSTRKAEGTGIGLAYSRELVQLMGGKIEVKSTVGEGTQFIVSIPVNRSASTPKSTHHFSEMEEKSTEVESSGNPPLIETADPEKPLLLVIEDNADVLAYLESLLHQSYRVEKARNGQKGIDKALEIVPDIIITDVMMPEKDGYQVCKELKNDERTSHIPIILLTAKAGTDDRIEGLKEGADAYLTKPFNKEELFIRLQKLITLRQTLQATYSGKDHFVRQVMANAKPNLEDRFLKKLIKMVQDRMDDPELSVGHLCKAVKLSNTQVNRKLKALTNKTPSQFIRSIRLQKALELLENSDLNISEIAYDVGFSDPNYFSRSFSEEFGLAPSKVRK
ncbi:MAG: two-component regulator propeller domain-containing protein [Bacteroidota bacterium]